MHTIHIKDLTYQSDLIGDMLTDADIILSDSDFSKWFRDDSLEGLDVMLSAHQIKLLERKALSIYKERLKQDIVDFEKNLSKHIIKFPTGWEVRCVISILNLSHKEAAKILGLTKNTLIDIMNDNNVVLQPIALLSLIEECE